LSPGDSSTPDSLSYWNDSEFLLQTASEYSNFTLADTYDSILPNAYVKQTPMWDITSK
jgi:hypothetical protein